MTAPWTTTDTNSGWDNTVEGLDNDDEEDGLSDGDEAVVPFLADL